MAVAKVIYKSSANATPETWMDATAATASAADITSPKTAMLADGVVTTGTGTTEPEEKDVDFIDYDGTLLYSYTAAEFLAMAEMPPNPSHAGLVAQGWNWTLADAKAYVTDHGFLAIGQNYTTNDGLTRIYITIDEREDSLAFPQFLYFLTSVANGAEIDWGDGSAKVTTANSTNSTQYSHNYSAYGDYVITIKVLSGTMLFGYWGSNSGMFWTNNNDSSQSALRVKKIEIGDNVRGFGSQPLSFAQHVRSISIPTTLTQENSPNPTLQGGALRGLVIPPNMTTVNSIGYSTRYVSFPKNLTSLGINNYLYPITKVALPDGITTLASYQFRDCRTLSRIALPNSVTDIPANFVANVGTREITIPSGVSSIGAKAFDVSATRSISRIHLRPTTPPTLENTNAFSNLSQYVVIYVPYSADHSVLAAYQSETNWSTFASKMQEEPQ